MIGVRPRVVLLLGGTGQFGQVLAERFLDAGDTVCVPYRSPERFAALQQRAAGRPGRREAERLSGFPIRDWADEAEVERCIAEITARFGGVDVLVNSAGLTRHATLEGLSPDVWEAMLHNNLGPVYLSLRLLLPRMIGQGWGRIIHVTSWKSQRGEAGLGAYAAVKAAVNRLTEAAAAEIPADPAVDVTVNAVLPAKLNTERNRSRLPEADPREWVQLEDAAAVVLFLASPESRAVNGACIPLYGKLFGREGKAPLVSGRS